jgi:hypothetical protein
MNFPVNVEAVFNMFVGADEVSVTIVGQITKGQDAARDEYGRPTECATAPDAFVTYISINGKEYTDQQAAYLFDLTVQEWDDRCVSELYEALEDLENAQDIDDELWF